VFVYYLQSYKRLVMDAAAWRGGDID